MKSTTTSNQRRVKLTPTHYTSLIKQLNWREQTLKPKLRWQLKSTRSLGDLSENSDYHNIKSDSKHNESKINEIKSILTTATIANEKPTSNRIGLNSTVIAKTKQNVIIILTIEGNNKITTNSTNVYLSPKTTKELLFKKRSDKFVLTTSGIPTIYKIITITIKHNQQTQTPNPSPPLTCLYPLQYPIPTSPS
ncbi:Transcription elongation factor GreA [Candidatus Hodgkinia cicadicola]|nr:Transcription elongation factor GreA [Candidatus Hodgkinia cicadicola]